jgi:hypothetical protein
VTKKETLCRLLRSGRGSKEVAVVVKEVVAICPSAAITAADEVNMTTVGGDNSGKTGVTGSSSSTSLPT